MENLLTYAVGEWGKDRAYTVRFGESGPVLLCTESDGTPVAGVWQEGDEIKTQLFYK